MGRVGVITHRERHDGGFNIVHIKDAIDNSFATRESNVFVIGQEKPWISLPKGKGVKVQRSIMNDHLKHAKTTFLAFNRRGEGPTPSSYDCQQLEGRIDTGRHGLSFGIRVAIKKHSISQQIRITI